MVDNIINIILINTLRNSIAQVVCFPSHTLIGMSLS